MIAYLLIICFFILLFYIPNENFTNYIKIEDSNQEIYKGLYKCKEYADLKLN
jgi:hypothetical protein